MTILSTDPVCGKAITDRDVRLDVQALRGLEDRLAKGGKYPEVLEQIRQAIRQKEHLAFNTPSISQLKAIPTRYKGITFRSRLEARYATFLDELGLQWQYETEGYNLEGVYYLPDFWLPGGPFWLEVKGPAVPEDAEEKAVLLARCSKISVYILVGEPWSDTLESYICEPGKDTKAKARPFWTEGPRLQAAMKAAREARF